MSVLSIPVLLQLAAACGGPAVPDARMVRDVAAGESSFQTTAIHDNASGRSYAPATVGEAVALARSLLAQGHRIDAGAMQITDHNWRWLGLDVETVFDQQKNVCAGKRVLAEAWEIERRVLCRYNTGKPDCTNGYPERIAAAWRQPLAAASDVLTPEPEPKPRAVMVNAMRNGGPPVPVLSDGTFDAVIHKRR